MTHFNLALLGFGNVGQALLQLLQRKAGQLEADYGLTFTITGIATARHGLAADPAGLNIEHALHLAASGGRLEALTTLSAPTDAFELLHLSQADVLFENTPVNYHTGQPALSYLRRALELGMHAITANKGPVVHGYQELTALAKEHGRKFYFESAVMDGAPIFSLFRAALPAAELHAFEAVEEALRRGNGDLLVDVEVDRIFFAIPLLYAQEGWRVRGDVVRALSADDDGAPAPALEPPPSPGEAPPAPW